MRVGPDPRGPVPIAAGSLGDEVGEVLGEDAVGHVNTARAPTLVEACEEEDFGGLSLLASPTGHRQQSNRKLLGPGGRRGAIERGGRVETRLV